jgi:hypothetical protein
MKIGATALKRYAGGKSETEREGELKIGVEFERILLLGLQLFGLLLLVDTSSCGRSYLVTISQKWA